jgi:hypothetical protein
MQAATQLADAAQVFGADDLGLEPKVAQEIVPVSPLPAPAGQVMNPHRLVEMAVERGMPIETIEKLLGLAERFDAMREAERKRRAESAYIGAIAGLKAEVVTVLKTKRVHYDTKDKEGRKSGSVDFRHAELADVMKALAAPAHRVGLTWNYPSVEQGDGWVRVTCRLRHVDGHFEDLTIGAPEDHSGKKNDIQAIASAITYMQRYTLKTILGIAEEGDDDFDRRSGDSVREREREEGGRTEVASSSGSPAAPNELDDLMRAGESHAAKGLQALTTWWGALSGKQRELVGSRFGDLKKAAQKAVQS